MCEELTRGPVMILRILFIIGFIAAGYGFYSYRYNDLGTRCLVSVWYFIAGPLISLLLFVFVGLFFHVFFVW
jgi:hypothetical protein